MARQIAPFKAGCPPPEPGKSGRTHFLIVDDRFIRWSCPDRKCPDCMRAKANGMRAFHVLDWNTRRQWTDYEPADSRQKEE